ncbi:MAG: SRPBCC family protein [Chloroflexota bacterium]
MNNPPSDGTVERVVKIAARPEIVYNYFVDPAKMLDWKGIDATLDPRPGGVYRVNVTGRDIARGEYVELQPYSRIVFTWGWEGEGHPLPPGSSTVEVTLTPEGDGTILRLRHSGLAEALRAPHAEGWDHYLDRLVIRAGGQDPGIDPWTAAPAAAQA